MMKACTKQTLAVIGGGAAGFFCAVNAAKMNPHLRVTILEKSNKLLSKVKVSGGGRCNVTHACFDILEMAKRYPRGGHFVKKIFHQFFTTDTIDWFKTRGIELKTEADGRMFPVTDSSQTIIDCLLGEAAKYKVEIEMQFDVKKILKEDNTFKIISSTGKNIFAENVCIAAGGFPKTGALSRLSTLGHAIVPPVPSLFTFNISGHDITKLMGISVGEALIKIQGEKLTEKGPLLITHWGLSGPCVLRLSAWAARELAAMNWQFGIIINWLPKFNEQQLKGELQRLRFQFASQKIHHKNPFTLPQRLWQFFLEECKISESTRWADLPAKQENILIKKLVNYECAVNGKTTFKEEFVTAGGISLSEIDANTMMSKKIPHLYFAGEVIDVDGITGGYNFQNAWSTGYVAAKSIAGNMNC